MAQKPVLGKGLASLLPSANAIANPATPMSVSQPIESSSKDRHLGISMAPVEEIRENSYQPRKDFDDQALLDLAQSIRSSGIIQPLVVRKNSKEGYELIAGERRLRAARLAGLKHVPIVIRRTTDREALELALIENIQRENLNCLDEGKAYAQLLEDFSLTQEEIAERVGKDRTSITNYLRLLRLPESIQGDLRNQLLTFGHAKALLGFADQEIMLKTRNEIIEKKLSVRDTEALVERLKNPSEQREAVPSRLSQYLERLAGELSKAWSTRIELKGSERRGKIVIHYSSQDDLNRILDQIHSEKVL